MALDQEQKESLQKMFLSCDVADQEFALVMFNQKEFGQIFFDLKDQLNELQDEYDYYIEQNMLMRIKRCISPSLHKL